MSFDTTILNTKIEGIKQAYQNGDFADVLVKALVAGGALMKERIFENNADIEGNGFGQYIGRKRKARLQTSTNVTQNKRNKNIAGLDLTSYQRKRLKAGRQIGHKDLEFSGGVRRAIETVVESETAAVLQFNNGAAAKIAHGQEAQITNIRNGIKATTRGKGIKIFTLNTSERDQVNKQGLELINKILKNK